MTSRTCDTWLTATSLNTSRTASRSPVVDTPPALAGADSCPPNVLSNASPNESDLARAGSLVSVATGVPRAGVAGRGVGTPCGGVVVRGDGTIGAAAVP